MADRFSRLWLLHLLLIGCIALAVRELSLLPDGKLRVHILDIGQGDSILLVSPSGKQILIDGGPDLTTLEHFGKFLPFLDRRIELLILTHPDKDHIAALPEIIRRYRVDRVLMTGIPHSIGQYDAFLAELVARNIPVSFADPQTDIDLGDGLILDIVWPPAQVITSATDTNNSSIVLRALYKTHALLFTGDLEAVGERMLLALGADIDSDILKAGHHGSKTSTTEEFLKAVTPDLALISAGKENSYGHPHAEIIKRLQEKGVAIRSTIDEGTISLEFE